MSCQDADGNDLVSIGGTSSRPDVTGTLFVELVSPYTMSNSAVCQHVSVAQQGFAIQDAFLTLEPTKEPTLVPTTDPTTAPSEDPTTSPTADPIKEPTTADPTKEPTTMPSVGPTSPVTSQ